MGTPPPLPRQPRGQRSGCVTALLIVAGVAGVLLITAFVSGWLFFRSDTGQRVVGLAREGITMSREAMTAPGTEALRAAGCREAMVMSMERMFELIAEIAPEVKNDPDVERFGRTMVVCHVPSGDPAPDCSEVARVYAGAVPDGPARFLVTVQDASGRDGRCQGIYGRDGTLLEEVDGRGRPQTPPAGGGAEPPVAPEQPVEPVDVERR